MNYYWSKILKMRLKINGRIVTVTAVKVASRRGGRGKTEKRRFYFIKSMGLMAKLGGGILLSRFQFTLKLSSF